MQDYASVALSTVSILHISIVSRRLANALVSPRGYLLPKVTVLLAGLYPFGPLDLIPNRLAFIGHLDDIFIFCMGLVVASHLVPPEPISDWTRTDGGKTPLPAAAPFHQRFGWALRGELLHALAILTDRPLLRLVLDRWPTSLECKRFRQGLLNSVAPGSPLLRGLAAVEGARAPLTRTMLLSWLLGDESYRGPMREGLGSLVPPGDHLRVWTKLPVSFLHVEKTAGTALTAWLSSHFHPVQIDPDPYRSMPPHVLTPFVHQASRRLGGYALVHGHYDLPSLRRLGASRTLILMLREPQARLLSMYYYWRSIDPELLGGGGENLQVRLAQQCGLYDFLSSKDPFVVNYTDNLYVRRLIGSYITADGMDVLSRQPTESLEAALAALSSIDVVGVTEHLGASLAWISRTLDLSGTELPVVNDASGNRRYRPSEFRAVEPEPVTPAIAAKLQTLTRLDRVIYEAGLRRVTLEAGEAFDMPKSCNQATATGRSWSCSEQKR